MSEKRDLVAISSDINYLDPARQVVANLYYNAHWKGDILLLAHEVPESALGWFRERGVLIKHVDHLFYNGHLPAATFSRYFLFTEEYKKWRSVVFLDVDIIVRSSIDHLCTLPGFNAVLGYKSTIRENFVREKAPELYDELEALYDLDAPAFNGGVLSWSTDIITSETFGELCRMTERYLPASRFANQGLLNLCFYKQWHQLPAVYNAYYPTNLRNEELMANAIILHFNGKKQKPWMEGNVFHERFYAEWHRNLLLADQIRDVTTPVSERVEQTRRLSRSALSHFTQVEAPVAGGF